MRRIESLIVAAYRVPTDRPESDGTLKWVETGVVVVHIGCGPFIGLGWTYGSRAVATLIEEALRPLVVGSDPETTEEIWQEMYRRLRNAGNRSLGSMAIAAVDIALWDLKARMTGLPLTRIWGRARDTVPVYGSGGFTSYTESQLARQLAGWVEKGITKVKMKVGRDPLRDQRRVAIARRAIGTKPELMVDANGAYTVKQALAMAQAFRESTVTWFEEPVSSENLEGLRLIRQGGPPGLDIAAGEYGDSLQYFRRMLESGAVDCLQADASRCGGFTGFLKAAALAEAFEIPLSAHCAPQIHAHVGCAAGTLRHVEYFHDHVRVDALLFEGCLSPSKGQLRPDPNCPGHGLSLRTSSARYAA